MAKKENPDLFDKIQTFSRPNMAKRSGNPDLIGHTAAWPDFGSGYCFWDQLHWILCPGATSALASLDFGSDYYFWDQLRWILCPGTTSAPASPDFGSGYCFWHQLRWILCPGTTYFCPSFSVPNYLYRPKFSKYRPFPDPLFTKNQT